MRKRKIRSDGSEMLWFISFSDLITAILAVLVMAMSFSKLDIEKFDHANRLMKDDALVTLPILEKEYDKLIKEHKLEDLVKILRDNRGLVINTSSTVQFKSGSSVLDEKGIKTLEPLLNKIVNDSQGRVIKIIGHTDDSGSLENNWELSSKRAYSVLIYLIHKGLKQEHTEVIAHAFNNPLVKVKGLSGEALSKARNQNRRVTIIIGRSGEKEVL